MSRPRNLRPVPRRSAAPQATVRVHLYSAEDLPLGSRQVPLVFEPGQGFTISHAVIPKTVDVDGVEVRVASLGLEVPGSPREVRTPLPG